MTSLRDQARHSLSKGADYKNLALRFNARAYKWNGVPREWTAQDVKMLVAKGDPDWSPPEPPPQPELTDAELAARRAQIEAMVRQARRRAAVAKVISSAVVVLLLAAAGWGYVALTNQRHVVPGTGATAECEDGTYSYSQHHQGTCSWHGGVDHWMDG